jgi:hypothetical protein
MNSTGIELLSNPQPSSHIVYSYTDETQLAEAVCLFASTGIRRVEAVLLVLSDAHYGPVRACLEHEGFNLQDLEATGHLICESAKNLLGSFMFDGIIDEHKFKTKIGRMIEMAKAGSGHGKDRPVRVFGEMVDLIWTSNLKATHRLEELWNDVIAAHSVPLLCAYALAGTRPNVLPESLQSCHSHAIV